MTGGIITRRIDLAAGSLALPAARGAAWRWTTS